MLQTAVVQSTSLPLSSTQPISLRFHDGEQLLVSTAKKKGNEVLGLTFGLQSILSSWQFSCARQSVDGAIVSAASGQVGVSRFFVVIPAQLNLHAVKFLIPRPRSLSASPHFFCLP